MEGGEEELKSVPASDTSRFDRFVMHRAGTMHPQIRRRENAVEVMELIKGSAELMKEEAKNPPSQVLRSVQQLGERDGFI